MQPQVLSWDCIIESDTAVTRAEATESIVQALPVWCRQGDWFSQYAAQGRRNGSSRVTSFPLFPYPAQVRV